MNIGRYVRRLARLMIVVTVGYLLYKGWQTEKQRDQARGGGVPE